MSRLLLSKMFVPIVALLCITFYFLRPAGVDGPMPEPVPQLGKGFDHQSWSRIISKVRRPDGTIDFQAVRDSKEELDKYLGALRASCPRSTPHRFRDRESRLAYYLNAYNAFALSALSMHCPMGSPSELYWADGVYWRLGIIVGESRTTLTTLESERIEPLVLRDPRVRFALFRGTLDAPLLQSSAFEAEMLESQLEEITNLALTQPEFVRESEGKIILNPLFFWHKKEFGDFHTWFKSRGLNFDAAKEFSPDVYDDTVAEYEKTCSALGR